MTGLLVTLQQQKTQTSGQDLLRNRWSDSVHKRDWNRERGNRDEARRENKMVPGKSGEFSPSIMMWLSVFLSSCTLLHSLSFTYDSAHAWFTLSGTSLYLPCWLTSLLIWSVMHMRASNTGSLGKKPQNLRQTWKSIYFSKCYVSQNKRIISYSQSKTTDLCTVCESMNLT